MINVIYFSGFIPLPLFASLYVVGILFLVYVAVRFNLLGYQPTIFEWKDNASGFSLRSEYSNFKSSNIFIKRIVIEYS